jgi:hypothetical protein
MVRLLLVSWFSQPMTPGRWLLVLVGVPLALFVEVVVLIGYKHLTNGSR